MKPLCLDAVWFCSTGFPAFGMALGDSFEGGRGVARVVNGG